MKKLVENFVMLSPILMSLICFTACTEDPADDVQPIATEATEVMLTEDEEAEDR